MESLLLTEKYERVKHLGKGSFGVVFLAKEKATQMPYAMKVISTNSNPYFVLQIENEINIMKKVSSHYTLSIKEAFYDTINGDYIIVTDHIQKGDVANLIKEKSFPKSTVSLVGFISQIAMAFIQINKQNILHRDLKPQNILIDKEDTYKVCDFGCSKVVNGAISELIDRSKLFGTEPYQSPQVYHQRKYNNTVDVWSLGVILYQLIYGRHPLGEDNTNGHKEQNIDFPEVENIDPKLIRLMENMLAVELQRRPKWRQLMNQLHQSFDFLISRLDQILGHTLALGKMLCLAIVLMKSNEAFFKDVCGVQMGHFKQLLNCMVVLQYEELADTEAVLKRLKQPDKYYIMPHVFQQFKNGQGTQEFQIMKNKNFKFRSIIPMQFAINDLRRKIKILSRQFYENLTDHQNHSVQTNIIYKIMEILKDYKFRTRIVNTHWLKRFCEEELHQIQTLWLT